MKQLQQGFVLAWILLLTACGFHLRGYESLPAEFNPIFISSQAPFDNLMKILNKRFQAANVQIVNQPADASYTLQVLSQSFSETAQSVSVDTQYRQYQLFYNANFQIIDKYNNVVVPEFSLGATRYYSTQTGQALGSAFEKNRLHDEMQSDVVSQLFNRLRSKNIKTLFVNHPNTLNNKHENSSTTTR